METLKKLRLNKNLTQKEVAEMLNINSTTYLGYEKGKFQPSIEILKKLSEIFNCSVDYLIDNKNNNAVYFIEEEDKIFFDTFQSLNSTNKLLAIAYCKGLYATQKN